MTENKTAVRSRVWRNGELELENFPFERISEFLEQDGCLVWVDLCDADAQDLAALAQELTLDPLAVETPSGTPNGPRPPATPPTRSSPPTR